MEVNPKHSARAQADFDLVTLAKEGDQNAYSKLMVRYKESVFHMILKMVHNRDDAEDITAITFAKAFNGIQNYNADFAFSTWLFKIATNTCIDHIRKKRLDVSPIERKVEGGEDGETRTIVVSDKQANPEEAIIKDQRAQNIRNVITKLNPTFRRVIELRYFEEKAYEEIAEELDLPIGTVKAQLFRAKDMLLKLLKASKENY